MDQIPKQRISVHECAVPPPACTYQCHNLCPTRYEYLLEGVPSTKDRRLLAGRDGVEGLGRTQIG